MMLALIDAGIEVEAQHHEVATGGQAEIDMKFGPLLLMADRVLLYKYIVKNVARKHGKTVTFMPKPLWDDNGTGMHTHFSFWKGSEPLFAGGQRIHAFQLATGHPLASLAQHLKQLVLSRRKVGQKCRDFGFPVGRV